MGVIDFFKKKKKIEKKPAFAPADAKALAGKKASAGKEEKKEEKIKPEIKRPEKKTALTYRVLVSPHVTEKATDLAEKNKYLFRVFPKTNKIEIKKAVEGLYGIDVISVNIINVPRRKRRLGRQMGWRKGYKKAIVKIKEGQKIEIMPR